MKELRLKTPPVAIKYFKEFNEDMEWEIADLGFYRPREPLNLCQFIGISRYHQRKTLVTAEDQVCKIGMLSSGAYPFDESMARGDIAIKDGARATPELCRELFQTLPRIPFGEVKAICFSPLGKMDLEADQVIVYGDPLQLLKLVQGYLYSNSARLESSMCAKYGVCVEGMAAAYESGIPCLGFPCRGERTSSIVQDHELFFTIPMKLLDDTIEGYTKTRHLLPYPLPFGGVDQSPISLPNHYLKMEKK
jgi:uncharacterized protein (DUF169 family)